MWGGIQVAITILNSYAGADNRTLSILPLIVCPRRLVYSCRRLFRVIVI